MSYMPTTLNKRKKKLLQLERICLMKVQKDYQIPNYNGTRNFKDEWFRKKIEFN